jgi:acetylornithine deacetylase
MAAPTMRADADYIATTLSDLVRINSINPAFSDGTTSEREAAEYVAAALEHLGMEALTHEAKPDRLSTVGRLAGAGGGRSLMLYGHLDTVGVGAMADPFGATVRDGRLYGRGAYDMKGGVVACIAAVKALVDAGITLAGDLLMVAPADEEVASIGMQQVLEHHRADAAVVTEPTELGFCLAHKGFTWIDVETTGRAAHGSRFEEGVDANMHMGRVLAELELVERELRGRPPHPLLGPPSLHAGVLRGGTGPSIYAAQCYLEIERRTLPGETEADVVREVEEIVERLAARDPTFQATVRPRLTREPFEVDPQAPIARAVEETANDVLGHAPGRVGMSYWMDAALLAAAGIETVVIGPSGTGAHADEEWVDLESVVRLAEILARTATAYCGTGG